VCVFFGHQSVGENVLEGIEDLQRGAAAPLTIAALDNGAGPAPGTLLHARIGRNEEPVTKFEAFERILEVQPAGAIDMALMKLCYIDIGEHTDVERLFDGYRTVLERLRQRHPETTFVHVTVPLRHCTGGFGVWLRERLGKPNRCKLANVRRHEYNTLVRRVCPPEPVFDLAALESTHTGGRRQTFAHGGRQVDNLIAAYTDDGGHLNAEGRRLVAGGLLGCLAAVAAARAVSAR
jgi:lysophospholipase L1-like esterase